MQPATLSNNEVMREAHASQQFTPLALETRPAVNTAAAAYYLNRRPQTLRCWASLEAGPLRPVRVHGRLAWKTEDIRRLLAEGSI